MTRLNLKIKIEPAKHLKYQALKKFTRPGKNNIAVRYQISGLQLTELQKYTSDMCEAFGLEDRIYKYKGTRPIALYRWDLDCILDVIDLNLHNARNYPNQLSDGYSALSELRRILKSEYQKTYET